MGDPAKGCDCGAEDWAGTVGKHNSLQVGEYRWKYRRFFSRALGCGVS
jgi:hypothetical protein